TQDGIGTNDDDIRSDSWIECQCAPTDRDPNSIQHAPNTRPLPELRTPHAANIDAFPGFAAGMTDGTISKPVDARVCGNFPTPISQTFAQIPKQLGAHNLIGREELVKKNGEWGTGQGGDVSLIFNRWSHATASIS